MNLSVIISKIGSFVKGVAGNGLLMAKKYAPEIMIGTGIIGFGVTVVETVKATNKTNEILETREEKLTNCTKRLAYDVERNKTGYMSEDYEKDVKIIKKGAKKELVKTWAPVATTGMASVILILGGYKVLNGRYVATTMAYKALETGFDRYRANVVNEFGEEVDWRMRNSIKTEDLEAERKQREEDAKTAAENKGKKLMKKKPKTLYQREVASAVFDKYSERWRDSWTAAQVWEYLKIVESQMDDKLQIDKNLFLNDVLYRLGLPKIKEGQVLGWIVKTNHPSHVSFGLDEMPDDAVRDFMNETVNENIWLRLHFNVDGMILGEIDPTPDLLMARN